ncbi:unnamed protein product [Spirodela intermedia]|uniref:RING-type domain-containing protein n=1 Tax=Spirodela intermedia TaxID=51605 RepID=A0A7I8J9D9_SPIIN|nr:unnamed protein product [Spirodela intermedia]CAA6666053.1 unnamed protein product [Spirodela intermedia]
MACATDGPLPLDFFFDLDLALAPSTSNAAILRSPGRVVAGMPTASSSSSGAPVCAICMEGFEDGRETPCGHVFHDECISSWLGLQNSCLSAATVSTPRIEERGLQLIRSTRIVNDVASSLRHRPYLCSGGSS